MNKNEMIGWLEFDTVNEASVVVSQINAHLGLPTPDSKTLTWCIPSCMSDDYYPNGTIQKWYVIIKGECYDCLTQEQKDNIITTLTYTIPCGMPAPSGDTENNL